MVALVIQKAFDYSPFSLQSFHERENTENRSNFFFSGLYNQLHSRIGSPTRSVFLKPVCSGYIGKTRTRPGLLNIKYVVYTYLIRHSRGRGRQICRRSGQGFSTFLML